MIIDLNNCFEKLIGEVIFFLLEKCSNFNRTENFRYPLAAAN
ncbi:hypothetical protein EV11_0605 [Prochlorococcus sp. SS52]|nr:hypothetical protein EV04_1275 [Prochlorococcus marinus str. LG]KGG21538.1 hypothetical protein EV08_0625 [Prochlorococcus marinus str. SS2]KGG36823.1 hypothetical protein EV11_0605 [Prochlorococcus sp. SS52]